MGAYENYLNVAQRVRDVAAACGRDPDSVRLIAVSKTVGPDAVQDVVRAGGHDFGENRPDVLAQKVAVVGTDPTWHFIGNIQSRKIPEIVASADLIHSLYQESHARKIDAAAAALGKVQDVLIEVNISGEASKIAATPDEAVSLARICESLPHVRLRGLMTMAPQGDADVARETFDGLAALKNKIAEGMEPENMATFDELSMGMSEDWPQAVAAGATMVRIGRAVFSDLFAADREAL